MIEINREIARGNIVAALSKMIERVLARRVPAASREQIQSEVEGRNRETGAMIAARYTRGNVSIQQGKILRREDLGPPGAPPPRIKRAPPTPPTPNEMKYCLTSRKQ